MAQAIMDIIKEKATAAGASAQLDGGTQIAVFIAGPIDEDYNPKVNNHHWEVATLTPVFILALAIDLDCCEVIDEEHKFVRDCHGWLSLNTHGKEHTLGVLIVVSSGGANVWTPVNVTNLRGGWGYLPVAVTFIGRNKEHHFKNVITQWHEELLKFVIGGGLTPTAH
ncbi:MAG TPA: hypothetical protein VF282_06840 [Bacillota bacterium]